MHVSGVSATAMPMPAEAKQMLAHRPALPSGCPSLQQRTDAPLSRAAHRTACFGLVWQPLTMSAPDMRTLNSTFLGGAKNSSAPCLGRPEGVAKAERRSMRH
eukprot:scaffold4523_cov63-Phaeocystis_antarctica.AAC.4